MVHRARGRCGSKGRHHFRLQLLGHADCATLEGIATRGGGINCAFTAPVGGVVGYVKRRVECGWLARHLTVGITGTDFGDARYAVRE